MALRLYPDEELVISTRPHARVLIGPVLILLVLSGLAGAGIALVPADLAPAGYLLIGVAAALLAVVFVLRPLLRWAATRTTLTTHRIVVQRGWLARSRAELPLNRIIEVGSKRRASDVGFGSGDLLLTTVSGQRLWLDNLPAIKAMCDAVAELAGQSEVDTSGSFPE